MPRTSLGDLLDVWRYFNRESLAQEELENKKALAAALYQQELEQNQQFMGAAPPDAAGMDMSSYMVTNPNFQAMQAANMAGRMQLEAARQAYERTGGVIDAKLGSQGKYEILRRDPVAGQFIQEMPTLMPGAGQQMPVSPFNIPINIGGGTQPFLQFKQESKEAEVLGKERIERGKDLRTKAEAANTYLQRIEQINRARKGQAGGKFANLFMSSLSFLQGITPEGTFPNADEIIGRDEQAQVVELAGAVDLVQKLEGQITEKEMEQSLRQMVSRLTTPQGRKYILASARQGAAQARSALEQFNAVKSKDYHVGWLPTFPEHITDLGRYEAQVEQFYSPQGQQPAMSDEERAKALGSRYKIWKEKQKQKKQQGAQ